MNRVFDPFCFATKDSGRLQNWVKTGSWGIKKQKIHDDHPHDDSDDGKATTGADDAADDEEKNARSDDGNVPSGSGVSNAGAMAMDKWQAWGPVEEPFWFRGKCPPNAWFLKRQRIVISGAPNSYDDLAGDQIFKILNCQCLEKGDALVQNASVEMQDLVVRANPNYIMMNGRFKTSLFLACNCLSNNS